MDGVRLVKEVIFLAHNLRLLSPGVHKEHKAFVAPEGLPPEHREIAYTLCALAPCLRSGSALFFQTETRSSALLYSDAPCGARVVLGAYGPERVDLVEALFTHILSESASRVILDYAPIDLAEIIAAVATQRSMCLRIHAIRGNTTIASFDKFLYFSVSS